MIDKKYLIQALRIRKDFNVINSKLVKLSSVLSSINEEIQNSLNKLIEIRDNSSKYDDKDTFVKDIESHLIEFETQSKRVEKIYNPLNIEMEKLKKEEANLYNTLIKLYKDKIGEDKIINEIKNYIKEQSV